MNRLAQAIARDLGHFTFVTTLLLSIFIIFCLPSSSVSPSHIILAVPMRR